MGDAASRDVRGCDATAEVTDLSLDLGRGVCVFAWFLIRLDGRQLFWIEARDASDALALAKQQNANARMVEVAEPPQSQYRVMPYLVDVEFRM